MKKILLISGFMLLLFVAKAQQTIPSADDVLKEAFKQAAKENKKVFIIFHASWCGWCHKMDTALNDPAITSFFTSNFIIRHLTVLESPDKKSLENKGAEALYTRYAGTNEGIPFWLVFDEKGVLLADSKERANGATTGQGGNNAGCPASKEEVDYFIYVLKKTTSLREADLQLIAKRFRENEQ